LEDGPGNRVGLFRGSGEAGRPAVGAVRRRRLSSSRNVQPGCCAGNARRGVKSAGKRETLRGERCMTLTVYTRPDGAYVVVPDSIRGDPWGGSRAWLLTHRERIDSDHFSIWSRVFSEIDDHFFAVFQPAIGCQLLGVECPGDSRRLIAFWAADLAQRVATNP